MKSLERHQLFNLAILIALFLISAWYLFDSWRASTHVYNLIFVLPLTTIILVVCAFTFVRELVHPLEIEATKDEQQEASPLPVIILFAAYVLLLPWLGLDVGSFLFIALFLRLTGEKSWQWALGYSAVFAFFCAMFFSYMLPYPMPLLLLPSLN